MGIFGLKTLAYIFGPVNNKPEHFAVFRYRTKSRFIDLFDAIGFVKNFMLRPGADPVLSSLARKRFRKLLLDLEFLKAEGYLDEEE